MTRQYDNRGRDQINIESVQGNVLIHPPPDRSRNEQLLLQEIEREVDSRLAQSLHNHAFITLDKEAQPQQVKRLWDAEVKIGAKPAESIPSETSILEVFERSEIAGKLLILGTPGAGKTTTMLDLARELLDKATEEPNEPIPVLFNLSDWKDVRQSMPDWLIDELKLNYGVRKDIGKKWLREKLLLPMLDGLDEVKPEHQESCVVAINQWLQGDFRPISIVVCCRREEYGNYQTQLGLNGAILLQALTEAQIQAYLSAVKRTELWLLLQQDAELLELVKTPLFLSITVLSYEELSLQRWHKLTSTQQRIKLLLDAYVQAMFRREFMSRAYDKLISPSARQTLYWLHFLAQQLQRESQTEFLIEQMQPSWLWSVVDIQRPLYNLVRRLVGIEIELAQTVRWQSESILGGLILGFILGIISLPVLLFIEKMRFISALIFSLIFLPVFIGLSFGLFGWIKEFEIEKVKTPNQGIWKSAINATVLGLVVGLPIAAILGLIFGLSGGLALGLFFAIFGLFFGFLVSMQTGGEACIQHFVLRLVLFQNGFIPWNYARFLNYCTERLFLQRVGGRYRFIHKLLQDYFAELATESISKRE
jgi:DNA polymerase III delta prime subunit